MVSFQNEMKHEMLNEILVPILELFKDVHRKALMRLEYEGLHTTEAVITPGARFHNDPAAYAMDRYAYYVCYKCKKVRIKCNITFSYFDSHNNLGLLWWRGQM